MKKNFWRISWTIAKVFGEGTFVYLAVHSKFDKMKNAWHSTKVEFVNTVFKKIITCLEGPINESIQYGPTDNIFLGLYLKNLNDVY